jgi:hypothetical protein
MELNILQTLEAEVGVAYFICSINASYLPS